MWVWRDLVAIFGTVLGGLITICYVLKLLFPWLKDDYLTVKALVKLAIRRAKYRKANKIMADIWEDRADKSPKKKFLIYQDNEYTYEYMEKQMNKAAHAGTQIGLKTGDIAAIIMNNEPTFLWVWYGLAKLGVIGALLNFHLRSKSLLHCFKISEAKVLIVGQSEELISAVKDIYPELEKMGVTVYVWAGNLASPSEFRSFDQIFHTAPDHRPDPGARRIENFSDPMCYIYTSGTTGLPKAAIVSHRKMLTGALLMRFGDIQENDVIYTPLPLYHSAAGIIATGAAIESGATLVLRTKFSATHFFEDCQRHKVTVIQYIGELCRYLLAKPPSDSDKNHVVRVAIGNGLRQDIWEEFQTRFKIPEIMEFYAATEGNIGLINVTNKTGAVGRSSPLSELIYPIRFVKYDYDTADPVRGPDGFCIKAKCDEPGMMVGAIKKDFEYEGYKGNKELSDKKVLRDVFKKGDIYFNSGDIFTRDKDYNVYFADRIGDTFRWKGENVSTIEVSNVMSKVSWMEDANVYGVAIPGQDGKAGMGSITLRKGHSISDSNLEELYKVCSDLLPIYAIPRFLRIQKELEVTATFKQKKTDLVKEGFNPKMCKNDPLYCVDLKEKTFISLDDELYQKIIAGKVRL